MRHVQIFTVNADGTGLTQLTSVPDFAGDPVWSPDGQKIAFARFSPTYGGPFGVYVMNGDGTSPVLVAEQAASPSWQPLSGPQRGDFKNAAQFCKAERDFRGDAAFAKKYGTDGNGANAYGKCVSAK